MAERQKLLTVIKYWPLLEFLR